MTAPDLKNVVLLTPAEVACLFRHEGNLKWVYDRANRGFLKQYVRRFGRSVYFDRRGIERLLTEGTRSP
jgi:hypothetical protein